MGIIDIIIAVLAAISLFSGIRKGLFRQLGGLAGLFLGVWAASKFSSVVSEWFIKQGWTSNEGATRAISFIIVILLAIVVMRLLGSILERIFSSISLGWVNRLLGAVFGLVCCTLLIGVLLDLIGYINGNWFTIVPKDLLDDSKICPYITQVTNTVMPFLKGMLEQGSGILKDGLQDAKEIIGI
ncbi:MAG: CvpA family protein [Bacteroidales bacterium]|nr:CvpA family protein [Bacteroidales bacterium]